jgi:ankyrin repeat protein
MVGRRTIVLVAGMIVLLAFVYVCYGGVIALRERHIREQRNRALIRAVVAGDLPSTTLLLRSGADPNWQGDRGMTPLDWAAYEGHTSIVRCLLDYGAEVNLTDRFGGTTLGMAAVRGHHVTLQLLVRRGADVNVSDIWGTTPLMFAAQALPRDYSGALRCAQVLLANGSRVDARNAQGKTALMFAASRGNMSMIRLLMSYGADARLVVYPP